MPRKSINVARDFSPFPGGRYRSDGRFSGERFRDDFLIPALKESDELAVELDGTEGYGSSFLDEAFGGLVRLRGFTAQELHKRIQLISDDASYVKEIWQYIESADRPAEAVG